MSKCIIVPVLILILVSCGNKSNKPPGLLSQEKMQTVLWDMIRADVLTSEYTIRDTSKNAAEENAKLQMNIFAIYGISREDFYNSLSYYKTNIGQMKQVLDSMINKANRTFSKNVISKTAIPVAK